MNTQSQMRALLNTIETWLEMENRRLSVNEQMAVCFAMMHDTPRDRLTFRFVCQDQTGGRRVTRR